MVNLSNIFRDKDKIWAPPSLPPYSSDKHDEMNLWLSYKPQEYEGIKIENK
jgi:hypothetical protein